MRINDTLKKAAGLLFEFDQPTAEEEFYRTMSEAKKEIAAPGAPSVAASPSPAPAPQPVPRPAPAAPKTAEQVVREAPGPNLDEIKVPATSAPAVAPDGKVDFGGIYRLAALPPSAFTAEQMLDLLATLPAELPLETKRATVKVTLNAMAQSTGVSAESIVTDASRKLAALAGFAQSYVRQADEFISKAELEISALEQEIAKRRQGIEDAKQKQASVSEACHQESDRLDDVLEFFSLDVPPSKYA